MAFWWATFPTIFMSVDQEKKYFVTNSVHHIG